MNNNVSVLDRVLVVFSHLYNSEPQARVELDDGRVITVRSGTLRFNPILNVPYTVDIRVVSPPNGRAFGFCFPSMESGVPVTPLSAEEFLPQEAYIKFCTQTLSFTERGKGGRLVTTFRGRKVSLSHSSARALGLRKHEGAAGVAGFLEEPRTARSNKTFIEFRALPLHRQHGVLPTSDEVSLALREGDAEAELSDEFFLYYHPVVVKARGDELVLVASKRQEAVFYSISDPHLNSETSSFADVKRAFRKDSEMYRQGEDTLDKTAALQNLEEKLRCAGKYIERREARSEMMEYEEYSSPPSTVPIMGTAPRKHANRRVVFPTLPVRVIEEFDGFQMIRDARDREFVRCAGRTLVVMDNRIQVGGREMTLDEWVDLPQAEREAVIATPR